PAAPARAPARPLARPASPPPQVAVLAAAGDVHALAASLALRLARGPAVVGLWTGDAAAPPAGSALPGTPRARRLAAALTARDLPARVSGRLVTVGLPAEEAAAAPGAHDRVASVARAVVR